MATLRESIATVASLLGRPVATVNTRAVRLRRTRLVPMEGRGLNAAHLGNRHLVRLLLAAMLPDTKLDDIPARVEKLDALAHNADAMRQGNWVLSERVPEDVVAEFDRVRNLGNALVILLGYFRRGVTAEDIGAGLVDFTIHISKDEALATVRLAPVEHPDNVLSIQFGQRQDHGQVPMMTSVTITPEVFAGLAELMQDSPK